MVVVVIPFTVTETSLTMVLALDDAPPPPPDPPRWAAVDPDWDDELVDLEDVPSEDVVVD
jgi:hypothetical protein